MRHTSGSKGNPDALQDVTVIRNQEQPRHLLSSPADRADLYFCIAHPQVKKFNADTTSAISSSILDDEDVFMTSLEPVEVVASTTCRKVVFATPLVTEVHETPRLTREEVRMLFYTREERKFFKRLAQMQMMIQENGKESFDDDVDDENNNCYTENTVNFAATSRKVPKGLKVITALPYADECPG